MARRARWLALTALLGCGAPEEAPEPPPAEAGGDAARALPAGALSDEQRAEIAALAALGYVEGDEPAAEAAGVLVYDRDRARPGYNLYTSEHAPRVFLLDMEGRPLHVWTYPWDRPDRPLLIRRVELLEAGELLVLLEGRGLARLSARGEVLWRWRGRAHHDFQRDGAGRVLVLTHESAIFPEVNPDKPIRDERITTLGPDGQVEREVSLIAALARSPCCADWLEGAEGDAFHANTLEILDGRLAARHPGWRAGNVLTSWRNQSAVGVLDLEREEVVWQTSGFFRRQHQPTVLPDGRLLLFDNHDRARGPGASRVIAFDPFSGEISWRFEGTPERPFGSRTGGSNQWLEGGHVLISETRKGRALEVAPDGEVVWLFQSPARAGQGGESAARLYELQRLPADTDLSWIPERAWPADILGAAP